MPVPTDYTAPAMTDGTTTLERANVRTWLQALGDHADDRCKVIEEGPINVEYFGAVANTECSGAIQEACDHYPYGAEVMIPPGKTFDIDTIIKPGTETAIDLRGRIRPLGTTDSMPCVFDFSVPGGKGRGGGIKGQGTILGNRVAHNLVYINSWHGINFKDWSACDQVFAAMYFKANSTPPSGGAAGSGDCDGNHVNHVLHYHRNAASGGIDTTERPMRFIYAEGAGGAGGGSSDNVVDGNCYVADGLAEASNPGGGTLDGGYGIEVVNAGRWQINNFGCFDNTRFYNGGVLLRVTGSTDQISCVVRDMYCEAQAASPPSGWKVAGVTVQVDAGAAGQNLDTVCTGILFKSALAAAQKLWTRNLVSLQPARILNLQWRQPRNHLSAGTNQITLAQGTNGCYIETMGDAVTAAPTGSILDNGSGNKKVNLLA